MKVYPSKRRETEGLRKAQYSCAMNVRGKVAVSENVGGGKNGRKPCSVHSLSEVQGYGGEQK